MWLQMYRGCECVVFLCLCDLLVFHMVAWLKLKLRLTCLAAKLLRMTMTMIMFADFSVVLYKDHVVVQVGNLAAKAIMSFW